MESLDFLHVIVRFRICRLVYYNLRCFCRKMDSIPLDIWRFPELISPLITLSIYFCSYLMLTFIACTFVRARVCVCLCFWTFTVKASSLCNNDVCSILDCTNQQSCDVSIILGASAKFLYLRF